MYSEVPEILQEFMMNTSVKKRGKIQPSVYSNVYYIKKNVPESQL